MVNLWKDLAAGPEVPDAVNVVVEIPKGSRNKYEFDKATGRSGWTACCILRSITPAIMA